jgi:ferredoxin
MAMSHLRMTVNPIMCTGHGICADLFPEWITLDDWGYPIIKPGDIPPALVDHARRAADACPTVALILRRVGSDGDAQTAAARRRRGSRQA